MRITSKGQVTIPAEIRELSGLLPHTEVEFSVANGVVQLRPKAGSHEHSRGAMIVARLRGRGIGTMSTDEIMALTRGE